MWPGKGQRSRTGRNENKVIRVKVFVRSPKLDWYWMVVIIASRGAGMYFLNWWYANRRFVKRPREMRNLLEEFA
ncbi:hypothetical protein DXN04_16085 [Chitinophaga silvisoli]|uniref:Uncharacterized protein n=1 Tax=Chitinophaga silvisoli TaxID=2291814 RepID=A0A3E1NZX7_9BACT|nr:hypothetical protein DXN04_16085 [Chitinophaga silvisoli]